ncbi:MAG: NADP-dependent phosphogluconate dehydrogenase [Cytophagales bacterium]|nr:NADP-dependent phosphogluconate dehydrogenase [Cytophagales bacterium]
MTYDFGLVGLGVMGRNFILNVAQNGFSSIGLSSNQNSINLLKSDGKSYEVDGTLDDKDFFQKLKRPRKIMLLVPAGKPVDSVIDRFLPYLEEGDIIIDGGNSHYDDTDRRYSFLKDKNINFIGAGVSGGSKGARLGPSIMPGCDVDIYEQIRPIFESASAKVNGDPCVTYLGNTSSGHYVKMIHNGIEYAIMQLISENYHILKYGLKLENNEIHNVFKKWNEGLLNSYLVEITRDIFLAKDDDSDNYIVDLILDKAKQKGTGKWTSQSAMDFGVSIPTIDSAVSMRIISSFKEMRLKGEKIYGDFIINDQSISVEDVEKSLLFSFIVSFAQGLSQLKTASKEKSYNLNFEEICKIWRGGCIIRAKLLENFMNAYRKDKNLDNLLFDDGISEIITNSISASRKVSIYCINNQIPAQGLLSSISYFDSLKTGRLPMNLVQAQRDCFGEHTFERIDKDGTFHYDRWQ